MALFRKESSQLNGSEMIDEEGHKGEQGTAVSRKPMCRAPCPRGTAWKYKLHECAKTEGREISKMNPFQSELHSTSNGEFFLSQITHERHRPAKFPAFFIFCFRFYGASQLS